MRSLVQRSVLWFGLGTLPLLSAAPALARESESAERNLTPAEIDAWLDARSPSKSEGRDAVSDEDRDVPPLPPRPHGFVVESSVGVVGHLGPMKHVSPSLPWFGLHFGYEPVRMLMVFVEGDLAVGTTSYAHPPPPPRSYVFWNAGAGLRLTLKPSDRFGIYVQGSAGFGRVTADVLKVYGYEHADQLSLYEGGELGLEWYQVNRHLALAVHGGVRHYGAGLERERDRETPLAWLSGVALRYTF